MNSLIKKISVSIFVLLLVGCTHSIHVSHMSGIDPVVSAKEANKKIVEVNAEQFVFMDFAFDTDYVDQAYQNIQNECDGQLTAVNTRFSTDHGFLSWTNKINIRAVCLR